MNLAELIRSRRSVGAFTAESVPLALVEELLESAVYAPNHRMTQPWRFVVITGDAVERYAQIRAEMVSDPAKAEGTHAKFAAIPLYLVVINQPNSNPEIAQEDYAASAALIQNFMLLAWERGLGTAWKTFKPDPRLYEFAGVAEGETVVGIVHVGWPAEEPRAGQRKPVSGRITLIDSAF